MEFQIYIIGQHNLQNQLLKDFLVKNLNASCQIFSEIPKKDDEKSENSIFPIFFLDCQSNELKLLQETINTSSKPNNDYFVLFNFTSEFQIYRELLDKGLRGLFFINDTPEMILKGVQAIAKGDLWFPREIMTRFLFEKFSDHDVSEKTMITSREREILILMSSGISRGEIAEKLCISIHTVKTHLYNVFKKINVSNRLEAALWVVKNL